MQDATESTAEIVKEILGESVMEVEKWQRRDGQEQSAVTEEVSVEDAAETCAAKIDAILVVVEEMMEEGSDVVRRAVWKEAMRRDLVDRHSRFGGRC
jgi:UDP-glucose 6-dehydrogenase